MTDKEMTCTKCGKTFTWTAGEQEFYAERGYSEPKKCKECREEAKRANNSNRNNFSNRY